MGEVGKAGKILLLLLSIFWLIGPGVMRTFGGIGILIYIIFVLFGIAMVAKGKL